MKARVKKKTQNNFRIKESKWKTLTIVFPLTASMEREKGSLREVTSVFR